MQNITANQSNTSKLKPTLTESSFGNLLLRLGKITPADFEKILLEQEKKGLRFGDAALKLGFINEADIRKVLAIQFDYPYLQAGQGNYSEKLVAAFQPFTQQAEELRALRSQLMIRWFGEGYKSLAIVSASDDEGSSYLAANLAIVFSQLGKRTLLVDANMRHPNQHKIFNLNENRGLSDILAGRASLDIATKVDSFVNLSILGAGTLPPNPQELLSQTCFTEFMNHAIEQYDIVLVDATPVAVTADAQATVARCFGALLVTRLNQTRLSEIIEMQDQIYLTGAKVVGAVINDF